jgi:uncharacterized protein DUF6011
MGRIAERNYTKKPHTARWLMTFHTAGGTARNVQEDTVTDPFANVQAAPAAPVDRRTPGQVTLMAKLVEDMRKLDAELAGRTEDYITRKSAAGAWESAARGGDVSLWIDKMISKLKELRASQAAAAPATEELEDGIYELDGEIIKVVHAIHGSGRQYGKRLTAPEVAGENGTWDMVSGVLNRLTPAHRMDLATAEKFGAIYGCCVRCGRGLTKETSIARAMGDKCAGAF